MADLSLDLSRNRPASFGLLCLVLIVTIGIFGAPVDVPAPLKYAVSAALLAAMVILAWRAGAWTILSSTPERRLVAFASVFLIATLALVALAPGSGPPEMAPAAKNELRYLVLCLSSLSLAIGMIVLKEALAASGERVFSTLAFGAALLAGGMDFLFSTISYEYAVLSLTPNGYGPAEITNSVSDAMLFFGSLLTYCAVAAFALSMRKLGWLGKRASSLFVGVSFFAIICLGARGVAFPSPQVSFQHWYTIPGWIFGVPAVPWVMPVILGLVLLRRAGRNP